MIKILKLDNIHCNILANILSFDATLHEFLSPNQPMRLISGTEYYVRCIE